MIGASIVLPIATTTGLYVLICGNRYGATRIAIFVRKTPVFRLLKFVSREPISLTPQYFCAV